MTTMLSLILAFMLSIGGSPAAGVNPAGCPGDTGIQAPIDNNRTINHFSDDYNQKTASRAKSKKVGEAPSIKDLETVNSTRSSRFSIEKLRQVRYSDHKSYRFNSVDPVINKIEALFDPQLWNLYAFCGNSPITYFDPTGKILEVTGGKNEVKDFKKFVYDNTGYNVDVKNGKVSLSGKRNKNVGNSTAAKYFEEAVTMKQTIKFDLMSKQGFLFDKWAGTGHALVDIGDLTSSQKSAGVIFSAGAFTHILSEQIFATKNNAGYRQSHAHAEKVVNSLRGAARRTYKVTGNSITFDFWNKGGRKVASFSFKLDKNLTPY